MEIWFGVPLTKDDRKSPETGNVYGPQHTSLVISSRTIASASSLTYITEESMGT